jgi:phosphate transport system substrate-binding protein
VRRVFGRPRRTACWKENFVQTRKRIRLTFLVGALVLSSLVGAAPSSAVTATKPVIDSGAKGKIAGSGATFPWSQYDEWFADFTAANPSIFKSSNVDAGLVLDYTGGGSSAGVTNFKGTDRQKATQMFSGTDSVLSSTDRTNINTAVGAGNWSVVPMTAGPIAMVYNLPGLKQKVNASSSKKVKATLKLNGEIVCGIYSGQIQQWDDEKIAALNPLITNLPNVDIGVVARSDGSGTTFIWASYLMKSAATAQKACGYHSGFTSNTSTDFSASVGTLTPAKTAPGDYFGAMRASLGAASISGQSGNAGIASYVDATSNTIGYVELAFAKANDLSIASLETKSKSGGKFRYLQPSLATAAAALAAAAATEDPVNPSTSFVQPVFATGTNSYPIVGYSWLIIYLDWHSGGSIASKGQVQGLTHFLNWAMTTGQLSSHLYSEGGVQCYLPLPSAVRALVITELKKVKYDDTLLVWN